MANDVADSILIQAVNMTVYDIPTDQICAAIGLSEEELAELKNTQAFKELLAETSVESFEQNKTLNDAWDGIEAQALGVIQDNLQWNQNPDFALKAAMVANKARRRGQLNDQPLASNPGARAVINLSANFINKLEQMNIVPRDERQVEKKQLDAMNPTQIEKMLDLKQDKSGEVEDTLRLAGAQFCIAGE